VIEYGLFSFFIYSINIHLYSSTEIFTFFAFLGLFLAFPLFAFNLPFELLDYFTFFVFLVFFFLGF